MFEPNARPHQRVFPPSLTYSSVFAAALVLGLLVFETLASVLPA